MTCLAIGEHEPRLKELASGIDALYLSGWGEVSGALLKDLAKAKESARSTGDLTTLDLGSVVAPVSRSGLNRYPYCLPFPEGRLAITGSRRLPPLHLQPSAEFLHAVGPTAAVEHFTRIADAFVEGLRWSASRLDVFSDWQGWMPEADDRVRFVGRAVNRVTHEVDDELTGFEFGRRKTKTVVARLYDKTRDMRAKGSDWWLDVWGAAHDPTQPVLRVEFELGRAGLTQHGVDSASQAIDLAPRLWRSVTDRWLSLRSPSGDGTRSRWPVAPEWRQIQAASFAASAVGLDRVGSGRRRGQLRLLLPQLNGFVASAAAHLDRSTIESGLDGIAPLLRDYELVSGKTFSERVRVRRHELGLA